MTDTVLSELGNGEGDTESRNRRWIALAAAA